MLASLEHGFTITVEVVGPAGPRADSLLDLLKSLNDLDFYGFSVATNPVARPRMSALALSALIRLKIGRPAILHCTTRDHNRLSLQGLLWGARALEIDTVLVATGDIVAPGATPAKNVNDVSVFELVEMARKSGLHTGVVFDWHPETDGMQSAVRRLRRKVRSGAQFIVTQPVYDERSFERIGEAIDQVGLPALLGVLPLRTPRHAEFIDEKVAGITVPEAVRRRMREATDPLAEGIGRARAMISRARERFAGVCLMPPFGHYEIVRELMSR
jgi:homocysteine S-methyltransferase